MRNSSPHGHGYVYSCFNLVSVKIQSKRGNWRTCAQTHGTWTNTGCALLDKFHTYGIHHLFDFIEFHVLQVDLLVDSIISVWIQRVIDVRCCVQRGSWHKNGLVKICPYADSLNVQTSISFQAPRHTSGPARGAGNVSTFLLIIITPT